MKIRTQTQSLSILLASALFAASLAACNAVPESEVGQASQAVSSARSASPGGPNARRGPSGQKRLNAQRGPSGQKGVDAPFDRTKGRGPGHRGPKDPSWLFERFDQDGDGKVALADLPEFKREWLAKADTDGDGALTLEEMKAHHEQRQAAFMKDMDADGDGEISDAEDAAFRAKRHEQRFAKEDANGDGFLTEDEVPAFKWSHLSTADANQDGRLTLDEIQTAIENGTLRPPRNRGPGKGGPGGHRGGQRGGPGGPGGPRAM